MAAKAGGGLLQLEKAADDFFQNRFLDLKEALTNDFIWNHVLLLIFTHNFIGRVSRIKGYPG